MCLALSSRPGACLHAKRISCTASASPVVLFRGRCSGIAAPRQYEVVHPRTRQHAQRRRLGRCCAQAGALSDAVSPKTASKPQLPPLDGSYEAATSFTPFANWVIPNALMVGTYPYVDPDNCKTYEQGESQIDKIITAGPHVFISLQGELPPQGEMKIGGQDGFLPYKPVVELIAASHTPPPPGDVVNGVRNPTIDRFLPQRKKAVNPEVTAYWSTERVSFAHWPLTSSGPINIDQLSQVVSDLQQRLAKGEVIYLHGWKGKGRVGTVGACLLAAVYGISADEALERAQRAFATRGDTSGDAASPATEEQRQLVRQFVAWLGQK